MLPTCRSQHSTLFFETDFAYAGGGSSNTPPSRKMYHGGERGVPPPLDPADAGRRHVLPAELGLRQAGGVDAESVGVVWVQIGLALRRLLYQERMQRKHLTPGPGAFEKVMAPIFMPPSVARGRPDLNEKYQKK